MVREERDKESVNLEIKRLVRKHFGLLYLIVGPDWNGSRVQNIYTISHIIELPRSLFGLRDIRENVVIYYDKEWNYDEEYPKISVYVKRESCIDNSRKFSQDYESVSHQEVTIGRGY